MVAEKSFSVVTCILDPPPPLLLHPFVKKSTQTSGRDNAYRHRERGEAVSHKWSCFAPFNSQSQQLIWGNPGHLSLEMGEGKRERERRSCHIGSDRNRGEKKGGTRNATRLKFRMLFVMPYLGHSGGSGRCRQAGRGTAADALGFGNNDSGFQFGDF